MSIEPKGRIKELEAQIIAEREKGNQCLLETKGLRDQKVFTTAQIERLTQENSDHKANSDNFRRMAEDWKNKYEKLSDRMREEVNTLNATNKLLGKNSDSYYDLYIQNKESAERLKRCLKIIFE